MKLFDNSVNNAGMLSGILNKTIKTYAFVRKDEKVESIDISSLNAMDDNDIVNEWGGYLHMLLEQRILYVSIVMNKQRKNISSNLNLFRVAVENTPDIKNGFCIGLGALRSSDCSAVIVRCCEKLDGSVDIDGQVKKIYPNDSRWDYAIGYDGRVFYVEIHPANTSDICNIIKKKEWLLAWLKTKAPKMDELVVGNPKFSWIATSSGIHISKQSTYMKKLAQHGLKPSRKVILE